MTTLKAPRLVWMDVTRIVAIFFVVLVHTSALPRTLTVTNFPSFLLFGVAKTCVPLFVMMSGALLLGKKESYGVFIKKRASRILVPWLFWVIVFLFVAFTYHPPTNIHQVWGGFVDALVTRFWFIPLIISLYAITPFLRLAVQSAKMRDLVIFLSVWFVALSLIPYFHTLAAFPLDSDQGLVRDTAQFIGYYILGFVLLKSKVHQDRRIVLSCILVGSLGALLFTALNPHSSMALFYRYFDYVSPFTVVLTAGIYLLIRRICSRLHEDTLLRIVADASFGIIFVHEAYNQFFWNSSLSPIHSWAVIPSFFASLGRSVFIFVLSLGTVLLIKKIPILRKVVS